MKKKSEKEAKDKDITIDMPEVKDIPGQEHIKPPRIREMIDTTVSSSGEEGEGILDELNTDDELINSPGSNVSESEKDLLRQAERPETEEDKDLKRAELDETDEDTPLNESSRILDMGEDLDVPGSELDDDEEDLGEEDEENNTYSGRD